MEKQRIFWVILSVSVFVVVVLVVGVFLLRQKPTDVAVEPASSVHTFSDPGTSPYEYGREPGGEPEVLNLVIGGEGGSTARQGEPAAPSTEQGPAAPGAQPLEQAPQPAEPAPQLEPQPKPAEPAPAATKPASTVGPEEAPKAEAKPEVAVAAKPAPAAAKPAPAAAKQAPAVAAKPAPATPKVQYWIQTGSYRSLTRAEELAEGLAEKGLAGRVFSYRSGSETFYRVRIGPYTNKKEAEKFLATVKQLQGLESSYISLVYRDPGPN